MAHASRGDGQFGNYELMITCSLNHTSRRLKLSILAAGDNLRRLSTFMTNRLGAEGENLNDTTMWPPWLHHQC
jgi:hypothetical protein